MPPESVRSANDFPIERVSRDNEHRSRRTQLRSPRSRLAWNCDAEGGAVVPRRRGGRFGPSAKRLSSRLDRHLDLLLDISTQNAPRWFTFPPTCGRAIENAASSTGSHPTITDYRTPRQRHSLPTRLPSVSPIPAALETTTRDSTATLKN